MIPYTDKAKKALNYANRLSRSSGCNYVGTEHILAGLLKEGTGVAAEVLTANNVELEALLKLIRKEPIEQKEYVVPIHLEVRSTT